MEAMPRVLIAASDVQNASKWISQVRKWEGSGLAVEIHGEWRGHWMQIEGACQTYLFPMWW